MIRQFSRIALVPIIEQQALPVPVDRLEEHADSPILGYGIYGVEPRSGEFCRLMLAPSADAARACAGHLAGQHVAHWDGKEIIFLDVIR